MKETKKLPVWRVFVGSFNDNKIIPYNIFAHSSFFEDVCKIMSDYRRNIKSPEVLLSGIPEKEYVHGKGIVTTHYSPDEHLSRKLRGIMMYYFWSKCEWETVVSTWPSNKGSAKIDVFTQVRMNWDNFLDYIKAHSSDFPAPRNKDLQDNMVRTYREEHKDEGVMNYGL